MKSTLRRLHSSACSCWGQCPQLLKILSSDPATCECMCGSGTSPKGFWLPHTMSLTPRCRQRSCSAYTIPSGPRCSTMLFPQTRLATGESATSVGQSTGCQ